MSQSGYALLHFFSDAAYNLTGFNISYRWEASVFVSSQSSFSTWKYRRRVWVLKVLSARFLARAAESVFVTSKHVPDGQTYLLRSEQLYFGDFTPDLLHTRPDLR